MNSGDSTWCAWNACCIPAKIGSSSQVSRGGRGCGNWVIHISSPCAIGSACSSRCSAVVPVRGSPITKIGRSIGTSACSGRELNCAWVSSRPTSADFTSERWK